METQSTATTVRTDPIRENSALCYFVCVLCFELHKVSMGVAPWQLVQLQSNKEYLPSDFDKCYRRHYIIVLAESAA